MSHNTDNQDSYEHCDKHDLDWTLSYSDECPFCMEEANDK